MTDAPVSAAARRARRQILALASLDAVLVLFPPVHWLVRGGSVGLGLGYFLVTGVVVILSLLVIARLDARVRA